jgi:hypothetical protein
MFILLYNQIFKREEILNIFPKSDTVIGEDIYFKIILVRRVFNEGKLGEKEVIIKKNILENEVGGYMKNILDKVNKYF